MTDKFIIKQVAIIRAETNARSLGDEARNALKKHFGRKGRNTVREALLPVFAQAYDVPLVEGERKAAGTLVLDKEAKNYEACRKTLGNTITFICGAASSGKVEAEFTKAQLKAAKQFLALFDSVSQARACLAAE